MTAKPSLFPSVGRVLVYGVLLLAAAAWLAHGRAHTTFFLWLLRSRGSRVLVDAS